VRTFGVIAILIAALAGASAQTADVQLDHLADDETPDGLSPQDDVPLRAELAPGPQLIGGRAPTVLLFGGYDVWREGVAAYGGVEWSATPHADHGFILRLPVSETTERFRPPGRTYTTDFIRAAVLPGWRFKRDGFELKLFAGPDFESRTLAPDLVGTRWRGAHGGIRVAVEGWAEPTSDTMLSAAFYASTIAGSYGARLAAGWRAYGSPWIGPEISGSCDEFSRQTRIGIHLTGLTLAALEWSAAGGAVRDSFGRSGVYTRLSGSLRH